MHGIDIIYSPVITEKSELAATQYNTYTFLVHNKASKYDIKRALQMIYGEIATEVRVVNINKKVKRRAHKSTSTHVNRYKKAMVSFGGAKIDYVTAEG
jgi:large subunit ribosomal protein L23